MPTLSLDRVSAPLPNAAPLQMARPKLTNIPVVSASSISNTGTATLKGKIPRNGDTVENHYNIDNTKTIAHATSQESTMVLTGDAISSKTFRENPQQGRKDEGGHLNAEHSDQDIQRPCHVEQQRSQYVKHGTVVGGGGAMIHPPQPPTRDREDAKQKEDQIRKKIQPPAPEKTKHLDEQCNFPTVTPLVVARNHTTVLPPPPQQQQQPGYSNQHQQHGTRNNTAAIMPSEQRPTNPQNGTGYATVKKLPQQQQQQHQPPPPPSHNRPQPSHIYNGNNTHYTSEQQVATVNSSVLPPSLHHNTHQLQSQPTLFIDRLVSEEVQEFKSYARIIESQNRRLSELENLHQDLENRLESSTIRRFEMEATLERQELEWTQKFIALEKECEEWKKLVSTEKIKNERLLDLVYRKDKEIQRMIQRKVYIYI